MYRENISWTVNFCHTYVHFASAFKFSIQTQTCLSYRHLNGICYVFCLLVVRKGQIALKRYRRRWRQSATSKHYLFHLTLTLSDSRNIDFQITLTDLWLFGEQLFVHALYFQVQETVCNLMLIYDINEAGISMIWSTHRDVIVFILFSTHKRRNKGISSLAQNRL